MLGVEAPKAFAGRSMRPARWAGRRGLGTRAVLLGDLRLMRGKTVSRHLRRALFGATACAAFALVLGPIPSKAGDQDVSQAEWPQSYEASPQMAVAREATPILSPATVDATEAAIQKYQDLVSRGGWSSVPAATRLQQLETNIIRLKAYSGDLGSRFVLVNIPAASVETVENGVVYSHHAAGVGKIDRQSPIMQTKATEINFNPFWTVPPSLIKKDLIPKMKADPNYLTDEKIRVFNKDGQEVSPASIDWNTDEATHYKYRQDMGADLNSLGFVRINIPNPYGVYMHDTPSKGIFGDDFRFVSSGCVRVQDVRDYVAWLLKDTPGWGRDQIDAVIRSGDRLDVKLAQPVNVYWIYVTAWATPDGVVQFRHDVYQRDGAGPGPLASAVPAQPVALPQE